MAERKCRRFTIASPVFQHRTVGSTPTHSAFSEGRGCATMLRFKQISAYRSIILGQHEQA